MNDSDFWESLQVGQQVPIVWIPGRAEPVKLRDHEHNQEPPFLDFLVLCLCTPALLLLGANLYPSLMGLQGIEVKRKRNPRNSGGKRE